MSDVTEGVAGVVRDFGLDPRTIGLRHRGWWIVQPPLDEEERIAGATVGHLCVKARDGASNPPDMKAGVHPNFVGTAQDGFDRTYRYYYYAPLKARETPPDSEPAKGEVGS